jgi:hypothetical protein
VASDPRPRQSDYTDKKEYTKAQNAWSKREKRRQNLAANVAASVAAAGGDAVADTKGHRKPSGRVPEVKVDGVSKPCNWDFLNGCWLHPVDGSVHLVERNKAQKAAQAASQVWRRAETKRIDKAAECRAGKGVPHRAYWAIAEPLVAECDGLTLAQFKRQLRDIEAEAIKASEERKKKKALEREAEYKERDHMEREDLPLQAKRAEKRAEEKAVEEAKRHRQWQRRYARLRSGHGDHLEFPCDGSHSRPRHPPVYYFRPTRPDHWTDQEFENWHLNLSCGWWECHFCYEISRMSKPRQEEIEALRKAPLLETIGLVKFKCTHRRCTANGRFQQCQRAFSAACKPFHWSDMQVMRFVWFGLTQ